jgi:hypothetical protein
MLGSPSFESSKFLNHIFKHQKTLYGLKQALESVSSV